LLDQHGKKLKPGYHHTGKTHGGRKGMGEGVEADEKAEKVQCLVVANHELCLTTLNGLKAEKVQCLVVAGTR
jgi:hypothetical protein